MYSKNFFKTFKNKRILITGGTGSFGSTLLSKLINYNLKEIIIFSRDEKKQDDLRLKYLNNKIKFIIGDVREFESINKAMDNVDYVFHAAALKQVPSGEFFPMETYKTNVIGTENSINAAINNKVKKFILLSTDKAVYPINAMGISKALAEKLLQAKSRTSKKKDTILCITRYGNVMGSRASVIPRFYNLIKKNKNLDLTDKRMTRFMMSLEDSINLVVEALIKGEQGDIFVQKSPACKILDLAKAIIKILNKKVKINVIGLRHGEKLNETLVSREEMIRSVENDKYFRIKIDNRNLNYSLYEKFGNKKSLFSKDFNSDNTSQLGIEEIIKLLNKINIDFD